MDAVITQLNSTGRSFVVFALPMLIQSSLLILILLGLNLIFGRKTRAVFRYWLLLLILIKLVLPTTLSAPTGIGYWVGGNFLNLTAQSQIASTPPVAGGEPAGPPPVTTPSQTVDSTVPSIDLGPSTEMAEHEAVPTLGPAEPVPAVLPSAIPMTWPAIALLIWLAVVGAMVLLLIQRLLFVKGLIAQSSDADGPLLALLEDCRNRLAIKKPISLKISPNATSPAVCGLFRPMILIPQNMPQQLDSRHLSAVLLHELAHIKRRDLWVNLAQTLLQIVYFYNPLLWLANAVIRRVREQAVDEMVLVAMGEKHEEYPDTLLAVARLSLARPALSLRLIGVVESKKALTQRIKHILSRPLPKTAKLGLLGLAIVIIAAAVLLPMAKVSDEPTAEQVTTQPGTNVAPEVHYTFDTDEGLDITHSKGGMKVAVEDGQLRTWGRTTDTNWGNDGTYVSVNDLGGSLDASIDFKLPKREDYGLVYMGLYPEGESGPPMILYQWQVRKKLWLIRPAEVRGWYQVHMRWLKVKWWLEKGRGTYPDVGKEDTEFVTMRMYLRENRRQIDYYVNDVLVDTLNLAEPLGRVNKAIVAFQTHKSGYGYDIRFDNLRISATPPGKSGPAELRAAGSETPIPAAEVHHTFDTDKGLDIVHSEEGMNVGVQDGELRVWGKTTNAKWGSEGTYVPVNDLGGSLDASIDFKLPKREDFGLVFMGLYPEGPTGPPMILYSWQIRKKLWLIRTGGPSGRYLIHTRYLEVKWWLKKGRRTYPDMGKEDSEFTTMRMYVRENRRQIDYYVNDVLVDTLNLAEPLGRVNKAIVAFQTHKSGYGYDIRFDNLRISATPPGKSGPAELRAAGSETPIPYSFRSPDYSLREEPQRKEAKTLGDPKPAPEDAVVFGWPIRWWSSHWSGSLLNTSAVAMQQHEDFARFIVTEPARRKVWVKYFDVPIDPERYPIVVMTYRARGTDVSNGTYALYLDDGSGPDYGGLLPFVQRDIIADGQVHTLTCDMRIMKPIGDLIGLAIGVYCDKKGPAEFDLIDLRFERATGVGQPPVAVPMHDSPLAVKVMDARGQAIPGATVLVDAERHNWARPAITNADGVATLRPYRTKTGRHMIRMTKLGMTTVEIRDLPPVGQLIIAVLEPAVSYGGVVNDENGQPLQGATVSIKVSYRPQRGLWTRKDAQVLTDDQGRWESPLLPANVDTVQIALAHPDYTSGPFYGATYQPSVAKLQLGEVVLAIKRGKIPTDPRRRRYNLFEIFRKKPTGPQRRDYNPSKIFRRLSDASRKQWDGVATYSTCKVKAMPTAHLIGKKDTVMLPDAILHSRDGQAEPSEQMNVTNS